LMVAIAYVWITEGTYDKNYVATHVLGFDSSTMPSGAPAKSSFSDHILGNADGVPKTPAWAEAICDVPAYTITALAEEWASKPTAIVTASSAFGGAIRRDNGANFVRMLFALQAISGNIGRSGGGCMNFFYFGPAL
jgi:anaerobic dimethyl sulfoxide reductase subunit A